MNTKRTRFCTRIFTLDRITRGISAFIWDENRLNNIVKEEEKHFGLKVSEKKEIQLLMEYSNIIWNYQIYYGSYKKRFKPLTENDERWEIIEEVLESDLKMMGLETLTKEILNNLKNKEYFEYQNKSKMQFKKYCIQE